MVACAMVCLLLMLYTQVIRELPGDQGRGPLTFSLASLAFGSVSLLLWRGMITYSTAAAVSITASGLVLAARLFSIFYGGVLDDPAQSVFLPVFSYYVLYYLVILVLLPYPLSLRVSLFVWVAMAVLTTVLAWPHLSDVPPRPLVKSLLLYIWVGHSLFLMLIFRAARLQHELVHGQERALNSLHKSQAGLAESESLLRGVFNQAAVGFALLDEHGRWLRINQRLCEITGYSETELKATTFQAITHPDDIDRDLLLSGKVLRGELAHYQLDKRYIRKDGSVTWVMLYVGRIEATSTSPPCFVSVVKDINERKATEQRVVALNNELEESVAIRTAQLQEMVAQMEQRNGELALITEMTGLLALARDFDEALTIVTRTARTVFARAKLEVYVTSMDFPERFVRRGPPGLTAMTAAFEASECWGLRRSRVHRIDEPGVALTCSHHSEHVQNNPHACVPLVTLGETFGVMSLSWQESADGWAPDPMLLTVLCEQAGLAIGNVRLRENLRQQAMLDPLTGLSNRRQLEEHLRRRTAEQVRSGRGFSLLLLDLDHFKSINDRFGHEAGDRVLQEAAGLFQRSVRGEEMAFRLGGEEFVIVLATEDPKEAWNAAERLRCEMERLRVSRRGEILPAVTVSIGVACFPLDAGNAADLLRNADAATYAAKHGGRNQVRRFDQLKPAGPEQPHRFGNRRRH
jgi:diguanylate cyclase (GGDEF)-like protein/PAS domain S-box-containing protein